MVEHEPEPKRFEPKVPVQLDPPKDDPITVEELSKCDGTDPSRPTLVAIKGIVFDVSKNPAYGPNGQYHGMPILPFPMYCKIIAGLVCTWRY
jgi:cytochrome b involved in lipid metabolism